MKRIFTIALLFILSAALFMLPSLAFAQADSTALTTEQRGNWVKDNWPWIIGVAIPFLLDALARIIPTSKNWSWLSWLGKFFEVLVPNKKAGGGKF